MVTSLTGNDMQIYHDYIKGLNPKVDPEAVLNVADELYRYFGEMTAGEWQICIDIVLEETR